MVRFAVFVTLFFGSCIYALLRGDRNLRLAGGALLVAGLASAFAAKAPGSAGTDISWPLFAIDSALFFVLLWIAVHSSRYWPMWLAGLHLTQVAGHVLPLVDHSITGWLYWFATAVWAYPIHLVLLLATYRHQTRTRLQRSQRSSAAVTQQPA